MTDRFIEAQTVWLRDVGTDRAEVILEHFGPLFRVREDWYTPNITEGWAVALNPTYHFTLSGASRAFEDRVRKVREVGEVEYED